MSEKTLKLIDNDRLIILVVSSLKNEILNFFSAESMQGKVQVSLQIFPRNSSS